MRNSLWLSLVTVAASWLGMMWTHELGHVLHALVSGGTVRHVDLHPLRLSQTHVWPNPHPLFVAWGGAVWGVGIPLAMWLIAWAMRRRWSYLLRFFAGLCLVVNGAYIGSGWLVEAGDAADMRALGTPVWVLLMFGVIGVASGLRLWHGLAVGFMQGSQRQTWAVMLVVGVLTAAGWMIAQHPSAVHP